MIVPKKCRLPNIADIEVEGAILPQSLDTNINNFNVMLHRMSGKTVPSYVAHEYSSRCVVTDAHRSLMWILTKVLLLALLPLWNIIAEHAADIVIGRQSA